MAVRTLSTSAMAALASIAVGSGLCMAAEIRIETGAGAGVSYTDNVNLEPGDEAEDALISTISGFANLRARGDRLILNLDSALYLDHSTEDGRVTLSPNLIGFASAELLEDHFFVDADASWSQRALRSDDSVSGNAATNRKRLSDVFAFGVSPYYRHRFGNLAEGELRYRHEEVVVEGPEASDLSTDEQSLLLRTGSAFTRLRLTGRAEHSDVRSSSDLGDQERLTGMIEADYALRREIALLAMAGYEDIDTGGREGDSAGPIWYAGLRLTPGPRTSLRFTFGERYGGTNLDGLFSYRISAAITFQASVTDYLQTGQQAILRDQRLLPAVPGNGDPAMPIVLPDGTILNPRDPGLGVFDETARVRRYQASLIGTLPRDTFRLTGIGEERDFEINGDEKVAGISGRWDHAFTPNLSAGATVSYRLTDREGPPAGTAHTILTLIGVTQRLTENLSITGSYAFSQRESDIRDESYTENAISIGARIVF